jgi:two-component system, OmpR family, sensor kinase
VTRLHRRVWMALVLVVGVSMTVSAVVVAALAEGRPLVTGMEQNLAVAARVAAAPADRLESELARIGRAADQDLSVYAADGQLIASTPRRVPFGASGWLRGRQAVGVRLVLPDGRLLALGGRADPQRRAVVLGWFGVLALALALGCYPIARRITRGLERLEEAVQRWGDGALDARAPVSGRDEVAAVAEAFNDAAGRVQRLVEAQRRVLASASHELRAPLARVRMALELLPGEERVLGAIRDVEEIDRTVGDLLQVGRMQAVGGPASPEPVDLLAVAAEEAARGDAVVDGSSWVVTGDRRLLGRMVRNLLENAARHGAPPVEVHVRPGRLEVLDRGPGVPEALRSRIFEPFFRPGGHDEGRDGGVGLGLHLVREIASHHGGDVTVEDREGGGARFVVTLKSS